MLTHSAVVEIQYITIPFLRGEFFYTIFMNFYVQLAAIVIYSSPMGKKFKIGEAKKVIVSISLRRASSRDVLSGVFHHLEKSSIWNISLMQPEENPLTPEKLRTAEGNGVAGVFITEADSSELMRALAETPLPVAVIGFNDSILKSRRGRTAFILNDNAGIGAMGAKYFLEIGKFNSFGFVLTNIGADWMAERAKAFRDMISAAIPGVTIKTFPASAATGSDEDIAALADWIAALPKPAAVMVGADWRAMHVLAACERAKVHVPDSVALLGVENDEFSCAHASPPLSSVLPGHVEMGRRAAEELERLIDGKGARRRKVMPVPPRTVVERESTRMRTPAALLVDRAKRFIQANALRGIDVSDVVEHLNVSRSLAEARYRAATGETIHTTIETMRMDRLKHLLVSTRRTVAALAAECGFHDANSLSHLFSKRFGISMRDYRAQARAR